ncbi:tRNA pseudouridine(38-40) synthase TruA [Thiothrix eikelboomii]|uniref:tRNA pseudouridine synthase A n=1 Tax=Thiothrix eikelboomii TaxID=92487 RepID=A0A1T4WPJ6_9GAMM|nr:tRNA pseudouridine(38-40) synthase TruA [Thiothrix eikelboomii]SKA79169.1 tRNA pseudouridine38-40 synthase [Thiothrix eikelboomii]
MKLAACVEYDGTAFCGWQRLSHASTVQASVERALSEVANEPIEAVCAGRTDSGVHASGQIIHFETKAERPLRGWLFGSNVKLPDGIALRWVQPVAEHFHARFSALSRRYRYVILNRWAKPAILKNKVAWYHHALDAPAMHQAAQVLVGEHDFSSFRASGCQATHARRYLQSIAVSRLGDFIYIDVVANAFLHHMVRNIVGSLLEVGSGEQKPEWIAQLLVERDRRLAGMTAAAAGLYFVYVEYPAEFGLPVDYSLPQFILS